MTLEETKKILQLLKLFYPNFDDSETVAIAWYGFLRDTPYEVSKTRLYEYIGVDKKGFPPTVAVLRAPSVKNNVADTMHYNPDTGRVDWTPVEGSFSTNIEVSRIASNEFIDSDGMIYAFPSNE